MKLKINCIEITLTDEKLKRLFKTGNLKEFVKRHNLLRTQYLLNYTKDIPEELKVYNHIASSLAIHNTFLINPLPPKHVYKIQRWCNKIPLSLFIEKDEYEEYKRLKAKYEK